MCVYTSGLRCASLLTYTSDSFYSKILRFLRQGQIPPHEIRAPRTPLNTLHPRHPVSESALKNLPSLIRNPPQPCTHSGERPPLRGSKLTDTPEKNPTITQKPVCLIYANEPRSSTWGSSRSARCDWTLSVLTGERPLPTNADASGCRMEGLSLVGTTLLLQRVV